MSKQYRTWIEISKKAVRNNYLAFRRIIKPGTKLMAVVKSNAYGHGLVGMAKIFSGLGADWLGVDSITEALTLRERKICKPILVMGYTLPQNFVLASRKKISLSVSAFESLRILARKKFPVAVHIKVETGLNRQGFLLDDLTEVIRILRASPHLRVEGLFTHFAKAHYPGDKSFTGQQIRKFWRAAAVFEEAGHRPLLHAAATGGALNFPQSHFDMVRVGIGLYGLWPTPETRHAHWKKVRLAPTLSWKTVVGEIKRAGRGETAGYYRTERLKRDSKLAVLPIGYWHGYDRRFSSIGQVLVRGRKAKVVGRVSMDMTVIDVTDIPAARVGDEVVLLGRQGYNEISADDLANLVKTINYEIVTRINPLIEKFYV